MPRDAACAHHAGKGHLPLASMFSTLCLSTLFKYLSYHTESSIIAVSGRMSC